MESWAGWGESCHQRCSPQSCCGSKRWEVSEVIPGPPIHQALVLFVQGSECTGFRSCLTLFTMRVDSCKSDWCLLSTLLSIFLRCWNVFLLLESQRKLLEQSCSLFWPSWLPVLESNRLVDTVSEVMYDCVLCKLPCAKKISLIKDHHINNVEAVTTWSLFCSIFFF